MRGALFRSISVVLCLALLLNAVFPRTVHADPTPLEFFRDIIVDDNPGAPGIGHDLYFVLPLNAQQINPNNYIFLDFPNFTNLTPPTNLTGNFGNPTYHISGTRISITNIALLPGTSLAISGVTATNPGSGKDYGVTLSIAENATGTIIRNQSVTQAVKGNNISVVSATVVSQLAAITLSGYTSPGAFVTVLEGASVVSTGTSTGNGFFSFPLTGLNPGDHTFQVSSTDALSRTTSQSVVETFLLTSSVTTVSNLLLSPTLSLDKTSITPGETLTISGLARPSSQVDIFTESPLSNYTVDTDSNGAYSLTLQSSDTQGYVVGQHRVYTIVEDSNGNQSLVSPTVNFTVVSANDTGGNNPAPTCNISQGDLNCDGKTNLTDFSILLFHWKTNHRVADINGDNIVNLLDFSIMMFYFHR